MARTETLGNLITRIRELGELRSAYVSDAALTVEINQSICELYDKMVHANQDYFESESSINLVADTAEYALPTDFYKLIGVEALRTDGSYVNLKKYNRSERNRWDLYTSVNKEFMEYRIRGGNIVFSPAPQTTETAGVRLLYVPAPTDLDEASDTFDFVNGWDDWVVYDCLIKFIGGKEEGDARVFQQQLERLDRRLMKSMSTRDQNEPDRIRNMEEEARDRLYPRFGAA